MKPTLLVCAPTGIEARALRAGLGADAVCHTGFGPRRSARTVTRLALRNFDSLAVAGIGGGLAPASRSGEVVVGGELRGVHGTIHCRFAPQLVEELQQEGLQARCGPIVTTDHVVHGAERAELARTGALAVDMESAELARAAAGRPLVVARVLLDTPREPLPLAATPRRLRQALAGLRLLSASLDRWSRAVRQTAEESTRSTLPGEGFS